MKRKSFVVLHLTAFLFSLFFISCSNSNKASKTTTVTFSMDRQTVNEALRAADDETPPTSENPVVSEEPEEEIEDDSEVQNAPYDAIYIDVFILGDDQQQKTALVKENEAISLKFKAVPIEAVIYAKAQIYSYTDSTKKIKNIFYSGKSSSITVREYNNKLSISLEKAKLTVTFETNGGSAVESVELVTGQKLTAPANPTFDNKKTKSVNAFMGWYTDSDFSTLYDFDTPVTQDLTLYARWLPDFVRVPAGKATNYLINGRVTLEIPELFVCQHEVTQAEYKAVTGLEPSLRAKKGNNYPVENVSWYDAIAYCNLLSIKEGLNPCYKIKNSVKPEDWGTVPTANNDDWNAVKVNLYANGYRLLTEVEWEFVASLGQANTEKAFDDLVLYSSNSKNNTQTVTNRQTDELGLCHMLGNVSEWCYDWYASLVDSQAGLSGPSAGTSRVRRGGDYTSSKDECSVEARSNNAPFYKDGTIGFRVARYISNAEWTQQEDNPGGNGGENGGETQENQENQETQKYKITFDSNGGSEVEVQFVISGNKVTAPAEPVKTGYIFKGWKCEDEIFDFESSVSGDITLTASWEAITYTIKFKPGISTDTSEMPLQTFRYDEEKTLSECTYAAPTGMKFAGWITDAEKINKQDSVVEYENKKLIKNLTDEDGTEFVLYALWIDKDRCTITYVLDDYDVTSLEPGSFLPSQAVTLPVVNETDGILVRAGYTFAGWFEDPGYNSATAITGWSSGTKEGDITLYGKFEPVTYTITYNGAGTDWTWASGYAAPGSYTIEDDGTLPSSEEINKNYYNFNGWYSTSDFNGNDITTLTFENAQALADSENKITLYAKWTLHQYNITYVLNDEMYNGNPSKSQADNNVNTTFNFDIESGPITIGNPSRTGYEFAGWNTKPDFSGSTVTMINPGTSTSQDHADVKLYANWTIKEFNIYYYADGSSGGMTPSPDKFTVESDTITLLTPETYPSWQKEGKTFVGWYESDTLTGDAISSITPAPDSGTYCDNVKVYGKWEFIHYTINYNTNCDGTTMDPTDYTKQTGTLTLEDPPAWTGHHFNGWYTSSDFSGDAVATLTFTNINALANSENKITLYAKWSSAGVNVTVQNPVDGDLEVQNTTTGDTYITLKIKDYDSTKTYTWSVDGTTITGTTTGFTISGDTLTITKAYLSEGTYVITLVQGAYSSTIAVTIN